MTELPKLARLTSWIGAIAFMVSEIETWQFMGRAPFTNRDRLFRAEQFIGIAVLSIMGIQDHA